MRQPNFLWLTGGSSVFIKYKIQLFFCFLACMFSEICQHTKMSDPVLNGAGVVFVSKFSLCHDYDVDCRDIR
jgi:hypothetical protein